MPYYKTTVIPQHPSQVFAALSNELTYAMLAHFAARFYAGVTASLSSAHSFFASQPSLPVRNDAESAFKNITRYGSLSP